VASLLHNILWFVSTQETHLCNHQALDQSIPTRALNKSHSHFSLLFLLQLNINFSFSSTGRDVLTRVLLLEILHDHSHLQIQKTTNSSTFSSPPASPNVSWDWLHPVSATNWNPRIFTLLARSAFILVGQLLKKLTFSPSLSWEGFQTKKFQTSQARYKLWLQLLAYLTLSMQFNLVLSSLL